jgi:hypothetical protein
MMERFVNNKFEKQEERSGRDLIAVLPSHLPGGRLIKTMLNFRIASVSA